MGKTPSRLRRAAGHGLFLLPGIIAVILYKALPGHPGFTERVFSRGIFRIISVPLGFLVSWIPFSVTELLAVLAFPAAVILTALLLRRMIRCGSGIARLRIAAGAGKVIGWVLSSALLMYMLMHGLNAYRLPAAELMGLDGPDQDTQVLYELCVMLAENASAERENTAADEKGGMILSHGRDAALRQAGEGYKVISKQYPFLWGSVNRAKPVRLSHFWSYTGISGMYFPMLCESNVNIDQPDSAIPAAAAHELAHARGFAREDECNFFACLSCFSHPSADYRYSGYLLAYIYCGNELYAIDRELWAQSRGFCSEGVIYDLQQRSLYWQQFEGPVQEKSQSVNNGFIQSQGVEDGIHSYNRVTALLVSWYQAEYTVN